MRHPPVGMPMRGGGQTFGRKMPITDSGDRQSSTSLSIRFALLAALSLTIMVLDHRGNAVIDRIRQGASMIVYPLQIGVDKPFSVWRWTRQALASREALLEENARLKGELRNHDVRLQRMATLEAENARLRAMLDSSERVADRMLVAEILSVDPAPHRRRFTINRGVLNGVHAGQALLDADGVVGQIDTVDALTSHAVLISDSNHGLPVAVNRTGLRTMALGTGETGLLNLPYLTNSADIREGDLLVTTGLGGVFPPGYPVGRVTVVQRRPGQSFARVMARPSAGLDRGREVLVVMNADEAGLTAAASDLVETRR